ncbi:MAG: aldehyde dehydrogenase family protein, partial [Oceanococcus sp.]
DTLSDAKDKGATVIQLNETQVANPETRKLPLHLVLDTSNDMTIRQRETFGPLLMVMTYKEPQEAIDYINAQDRPLAFYPFSNDKKLVSNYLNRVMSGGVTVNDALFHVGQHDLPFGGVGGSGMGHYHGYDGFLTFSKLRPVYYQAPFTAMQLLRPPYGKFATWVFNLLVKLKS